MAITAGPHTLHLRSVSECCACPHAALWQGWQEALLNCRLLSGLNCQQATLEDSPGPTTSAPRPSISAMRSASRCRRALTRRDTSTGMVSAST